MLVREEVEVAYMILMLLCIHVDASIQHFCNMLYYAAGATGSGATGATGATGMCLLLQKDYK